MSGKNHKHGYIHIIKHNMFANTSNEQRLLPEFLTHTKDHTYRLNV